MSLDERFQAAVTIIQNLPKKGPVSPSYDQKLKFYSLYKQATIGDVNTEKPGIFSFIERKKWDAWKIIEGLSADQAKQQYIEDCIKMFDQICEAKQFNISEWLAENKIEDLIKEKLALFGKVI